MIKYKLDIKLTVINGDREITDTYNEEGEGPSIGIDEDIDMFVKPRIEAGGFILAKRIKKELKE